MADSVVAIDINGNEEDSRQIETLLIDLDDTLYQVHEAPVLVRENIQGLSESSRARLSVTRPLCHMPSAHENTVCLAAYMKFKLQIPEADIQKVCLEYYTNYGTTMAGLVVRELRGICLPVDA